MTKRDEERNRDWADLLAELEDVTARDGPTPCAGSLDWISDDPDTQAWAASACLDCPPAAFRACLTYATKWPREEGVLAGTTPTERRKKR